MGTVWGCLWEWTVWGCLWRMCGWMRLKLCGSVIEIHGKASQVLQGRSEPPRHSKQPSQPSSHPPHLPPRAICQGLRRQFVLHILVQLGLRLGPKAVG